MNDFGIEMPIWGAPRSFIGSAKKRKLLASVVRVVPPAFSLDGHLIEIDESWLQKSSSTQASPLRLFFTFKIDGKLQFSGRWPGMFGLVFKEDGSAHTQGVGVHNRWNKFGVLKALTVGMKDGWIIHSTGFRSETTVPESIKLRVGTEDQGVTKLSDQVLTFELTPAANGS